MQFLILSMTLAVQPPAVPDGPPTVPDGPPAVAPLYIPPADEPVSKPNEPDDGPYIHWLDSNTFSLPSKLASIQGDLGSAVAIYAPINGEWKRYATIQTPTVIKVHAALEKARATWTAEKAVSRTATGKSWPLPSNADAEIDPTVVGKPQGPWPEILPFASDLRRYKRAGYTQAISVVNGRDSIVPVHRSQVEEKLWGASGGLLGVDGWRSDLYWNGVKPREFIASVGVKNSFGYIQQNRARQFDFPVGTRFLDVLSNTDSSKPFEVRERLKEGDGWKNRVLFTNENERPRFYSGLSRSCVSCHRDGPSSGAYNGPLAPGSDQTFSFPFSALEK